MVKKRITKKEKSLRANAKKELQEKGIIPPNKKPLNRKKFKKEVLEEWNSFDKFEGLLCILEGISWVIANNFEISLEQVGVLKALKIAIEVKRFKAEKRESSEDTYLIDELYQKIKPILDL